MSSPPKEKIDTKAGHLPAVKAGGMRIVQKHQTANDVPEKKDDKDSKEYETESPPKLHVVVSGVLTKGIKTSPLLLPRWPIRSQCPQCRSCLLATRSTNISTSLASEPPPRSTTSGTPHGVRTTLPPKACSGCQGSLAVKHSRTPPPPVCACKCPVSTNIMTNVPFTHFFPVHHCNTKFECSIANH